MTLVWNQLKPKDNYYVQIAQPLSSYQLQTLVHLYQPIMGATALALYMTMLYDVDGEKHYSNAKNHQWLINVMGVSLDQIFNGRQRLEALGLIKTFLQETEDSTIIEYLLLPPLHPEKFFEDDILSICLYNQVGSTRYRDLRSKYSYLLSFQEKTSSQHKKEVTKEFHEVFTSLHPSELVAMQGTEMQQDFIRMEKELPLPTAHESWNNQPAYERYAINMEALKGFFMRGMDSHKILTDENLAEIKKIAYFYQLDEWQLSRIIQDSLIYEDELSLPILREKAKDWYRLQQGGKPPQIKQVVQPMAARVMKEETLTTEEEKHLYQLENISPIQLLEGYQGGSKIAEADLKLVEELLFDFQLNPSVVNLLLEYILMTNEFKLPKNLVNKVAAHWKRLNIVNVRQAQDLAKKEHQQYKGWKEQKEKEPTPTRNQKASSKKAPKKDILPEWIQNQTKQQVSKVEGQTSSKDTLTEQQKRARMESLLKELGEWEEKSDGSNR